MKNNTRGAIKHYFFIGSFMVALSTVTLVYLYAASDYSPARKPSTSIGILPNGDNFVTDEGMSVQPAKLNNNDVGYYDKSDVINYVWPEDKSAGESDDGTSKVAVVIPTSPVTDPTGLGGPSDAARISN
ncbi:MAG: hypothetical protein ACKVQC_03990 [Elusimicrobiota bacterium]